MKERKSLDILYDVRHLSSVDQSKKEALMTQAKLQSDYSCVPFYSGRRAVGTGGPGEGPWPCQFSFWLIINPILTRGTDYANHITTCPSRFSDLPMALHGKKPQHIAYMITFRPLPPFLLTLYDLSEFSIVRIFSILKKVVGLPRFLNST